MARYKKGESGNPTGRPIGTQNKETVNLREWLKKITVESRDQIEADIKGLKPLERCMLIVKLLEYVMPKMRETEVTINERDRLMKKLFGNGNEE